MNRSVTLYAPCYDIRQATCLRPIVIDGSRSISRKPIICVKSLPSFSRRRESVAGYQASSRISLTCAAVVIGRGFIRTGG